MGIWFRNPKIEEADGLGNNTLVESLGIRITELGDDFLRGTMPVDHRTVQPYGILHGGASVSLAETLGSIAAHLVVDSSKFYTVGMEINANHIRPATSGHVIGTAKPIHIGKSSQVWGIEITNEENKLVCISRITMAVVPKEKIKR
ncbi:MAG: hotdog fold thioesterase [Flavobacteriales bacterium]